jgi:hypothetical protein
MDKLSNAQGAEVLTDAAALIRAQDATISELTEKLAAKERRERVEKLAAAMHTKGVNLDVPVETLIDRLEKTAAAGKLETVEQAVDFIGPDMGEKLAQLNNHDERGASSGSSAFEQFIIAGGVG